MLKEKRDRQIYIAENDYGTVHPPDMERSALIKRLFNIENRKKGKSRNRVYSAVESYIHLFNRSVQPLIRRRTAVKERPDGTGKGRHLSIFPVLKELIDRKVGDVNGGQ
ncbi:hypothetical protein [Bacillus atrophaeus]|uniref:hypothetical protein n=1 Tax=Bacillus atrophaeus TaxID=1452 RepID=UPI0012399501|nr:hypothetical protein [Bacillus atrophaeus]KAA6448052.1 hypothetical protein DX926_15360 [Bacillus atrophaeus]